MIFVFRRNDGQPGRDEDDSSHYEKGSITFDDVMLIFAGKNMELIELSKRIRRCDLEKPYAFISYCSKDSAIVWEDVYRLQREGYNIWIDTNLKETDESWKVGALDAIRDIDCKLFVYYMSKSSVVSVPCLDELRCLNSREAKNNHGGNTIPWIAVEVDAIENLSQFKEEVYKGIEADTSVPRAVRNQMASTLASLMEEFFPDEERIRIKSKGDSSKRYDYYKKIMDNLGEAGVAKVENDELYAISVGMLNSQTQYDASIDLLEYLATEKQHLTAILMLAFILGTGVCGICDKERSDEQLLLGYLQKDAGEWREFADSLKERHMYKEAVAYYMAYAMNEKNPESFLEAARIWMKIDNFEFAKKCAQEASNLHDPTGIKLYDGLKKMNRDTFSEFVKKQA